MKLNVFFLAFLLSSALLWTFYMIPIATGKTIWVPQDFETINEAIANASPGDTILVANGTYHERVVVNKRVIIIGENKTNTIIDGDATGHVVTITENRVEIRGFTIRNGGNEYNGIDMTGVGSAVITDNIVTQNAAGIYLSQSDGNTIAGNTFFDNSIYGINVFYSLSNNITNNVVSESAYGIQLDACNSTFVVRNEISNNSYGVYVTHSSNNTVSNNTLLQNSFGILPAYSENIIVRNNVVRGSTYGIEVYGSTNISIINNTVSDNPTYAIYLVHSNLNTLKGNTISRNDWGIQLYNSTSNTVIQNLISLNTYGIYLTSGSEQNTFYHNNILDNAKQAKVDLFLTNTWDNGTQGNYWSDYKGKDNNEDGIGDTPYTINTFNKDRYPLMAPWGVHDVAITSVTISATEVYQGENVNITVIAKNEGMTETFNVTTYANSTIIGQQTVSSLVPGGSETLLFTWNTTTFSGGIYIIKAEASLVPGETDTADNIYIDGTVTVMVPSVRDVAIVSVTVSSNKVYIGVGVNITVVAKNLGNTIESFNVTATYENITLGIIETVKTQKISNLEPSENKTLIFVWNTTDVQPCINYTIKAEASTVPNETNVDNNVFVDGTVKIDMPDLNGDGKVNIIDLAIVGKAYGSEPGDPLWNPIADVNEDGIVNIVDLSIVGRQYGKSACG